MRFILKTLFLAALTLIALYGLLWLIERGLAKTDYCYYSDESGQGYILGECNV